MSADNKPTQKLVQADLDKKIEANKVFVFDFDGTITLLEGKYSHKTINYEWQLAQLLGSNSAAYKYLIGDNCTLKNLDEKTIKETQADNIFTSEIKNELLSKLFKLETKYMYTPIDRLKKISKGFEPTLKKLLGEGSEAYKYIFTKGCKLQRLDFETIFLAKTDQQFTPLIKRNLLKKLGSIPDVFRIDELKQLMSADKDFLERLQAILGKDSPAHKYLTSDDCKLFDLRLSTIENTPLDKEFTQEIKKEFSDNLVRKDLVETIKELHEQRKGIVYIVSFSSAETLKESLGIIGLEVGEGKHVELVNCKSDEMWQTVRYNKEAGKHQLKVWDFSRTHQVKHMIDCHYDLKNSEENELVIKNLDYDSDDILMDDNIDLMLVSQPEEKTQGDFDVFFIDDSDRNHQEFQDGKIFLANLLKTTGVKSGLDLLNELNTSQKTDDFIKNFKGKLGPKQELVIKFLGKNNYDDLWKNHSDMANEVIVLSKAITVRSMNKSLIPVPVKANQKDKKLESIIREHAGLAQKNSQEIVKKNNSTFFDQSKTSDKPSCSSDNNKKQAMK